MSKLSELKACCNLHDVARLLGYKPSTLSFIIRKQTDEDKYNLVIMPKRNGGFRTLHVPSSKLKRLQRKLATILVECNKDIETSYGSRKIVAHAFKKDCSIITNARNHVGKRYVFNIDLRDFFPSINFGRIRGYFIKNRDFALHPDVATVLAQIICFQGALPQGSPISPMISNMIGHILDIKLIKLSKTNKCDYSRYADDITFSTSKKVFPNDIAFYNEQDIWQCSDKLSKTINNCGFSVNPNKTRMQFRGSRQTVTGLTVNDKPNVPADLYRAARSMCNSLFHTGTYKFPYMRDKDAQTNKCDTGSIEALLGYVSYVKVGFPNTLRNQETKIKILETSIGKLRRKLLQYKYFANPTFPIVICEGKTDSIYLKCAISQLNFPDKFGSTIEELRRLKFLSYSRTVIELLGLVNGSDSLRQLIAGYELSMTKFSYKPMKNPVILLFDNDDGIKNTMALLKQKFKIDISHSTTREFYHVTHNLYVVKTAEKGVDSQSCIEEYFSQKVLGITLDDCVFNHKKEHEAVGEYGKLAFAANVVKRYKNQIDFENFRSLLARLIAVDRYHKLHTAKSN